MADGNYDPDLLQTERPSGTPTVKVRPRLSRDDLEKLVRKYNPDITENAVKGEVDNVERESSGVSSNDTGDSGTSGGLYQHHNTRLTGLKDFAAKHGKDWTDPEIQVQYSRLEKERDYPGLLKLQQSNDDRNANEEAFKRVFERPASVLWQHGSNGEPVTENDRYKYSDYALKEFADQRGVDVRYMDPAEYLQLTGPHAEKPGESPSGRSLLRSLDQGEPIEQLPRLDVSVDGPTASVTDHDGSQRAMLAQQQGIPAMPVAVKGVTGNPTEIVGKDGVPQAFDHPRHPHQETLEQLKEPISLLEQAKEAIVPQAEAAENPYAKYAIPQETPSENPYAKYAAQQPADTSGGTKPVSEMSEQEAQGGNLTPEQQREWMDAQQSQFAGRATAGPVSPDTAASVARGVAPYAAGAAAGAAMGAPFAGVGAVPGAIAGAGAVGLDQLATGLAGVPGPQQATNALLDRLGVQKPDTPVQRIIEQTSEGAANALTGAGALKQVGNAMRNPASRATVDFIESRASKVVNALADNPTMQTMSGALSGLSAQLAAEAGLGRGWQVAAGLMGGLIPGTRGMMPNWRHVDVSPLAKEGIEAGFVIHPADASVDRTGGLSITDAAAAEAGKTKANQLATVKNSIVANMLAQEDIGLPRGTALTPANFKVAEAPAAAVYREVEKAVPEVDLARSPQFTDFVRSLGARSAETERLFPEMAGSPEIIQVRDQLLQNERAATPSVMEKIADLREQAAANYQKDDAHAHRLANVQRQAAQAMEEAMEDSVKNAPRYFQEKVNESRAVRAEATADFDYINRSAISDPLSPMGRQLEQARRKVEMANDATKQWEGKLAEAQKNNDYYQGLPDRFRQARQLFAKIYDLKSVTNKSTYDVSARGLARLLERGKPLTGNLKLIADMANSFTKAFQNPSVIGGVESMSILDAAFAGTEMAKAVGKLATGNPGGFANLGLMLAALARKGIRGNVMLPEYQKAMIAPREAGQVPLSALTTPALPTQPVPGNPGGNALLGLTTQQ